MNITLIGWLVAIVGGFVAYIGWARSGKLKKEVIKKDAKLRAIEKNLSQIKEADAEDRKAREAVQQIDRDIVNAKTQKDAARIRRHFIDNAFIGL